MKTDKQLLRYIELYKDCELMEIKQQISSMPESNPDKEAFHEIFINDYIINMTRGFIVYPKRIAGRDEAISILEDYIADYDNDFFSAYLAFLKGQYKRCTKYISKLIETNPVTNEDKIIDEQAFAYSIIEPFKNAFPGFYPAVRKALNKVPADDCVKMLCDCMEAFYSYNDTEKKSEALLPVLQQYPDSIIGNMLIGYTYYQGKRWGNAIACFERVETQTDFGLFWNDDLWFYKGFSYFKLREHDKAIRCYKKALELEPNSPFSLNNLGYEYYLTKQYPRALKIFGQCLEEDRDLGPAANNYVRTLLALGRNKDAKDFVAKGKCKVAPSIVKRVKRAEDSNTVITNTTIAVENDADHVVDSCGVTVSSDNQFSSEKVLEDELELRIDAGIPVFGKHLKIYRRHGEYGRQYIIPIGRLDLLTEDDKGDLYIIELKKDSGYDDPYEQTVAYLEWFQKNFRKRGQKIRGIICLNNPTETLINKVRKDDRIQLFNYSISYDEIK